jgi:hypothetical protein
MRRRKMITSSPCVGAGGRSVFRRHRNRTVAWLSVSFSIPPKMERSTYRLISTHRSKRKSSHFFVKRESCQTKLRLQVSSSNAARPRPLRLAASGSESSLLSYFWYRRWIGRKAVARQNRNDRAGRAGTSSRDKAQRLHSIASRSPLNDARRGALNSDGRTFLGKNGQIENQVCL